MKDIVKIMFEMYAHREGGKPNFPEAYFDVEKKLLATLSKEQYQMFLDYESEIMQLVTNEQMSVFEYILEVLCGE